MLAGQRPPVSCRTSPPQGGRSRASPAASILHCRGLAKATRPADLFEALSDQPETTGPLSNDPDVSPFATWTKVYLPYCNQDVFIGGGTTSNFEQITDVGRDQNFALQALDGLRDVTRRYPGTPYATDAMVKIDMVNDQLAGKEMSIGRYYQRAGQPLAAINRYKAVIDNEAYQRTSHTPEALYRLVEVYVGLGLKDEATRNGAVLGHNYPGSPWYAEAYALLTEEGSRPDVQPTGQRESWLRRLIPG